MAGVVCGGARVVAVIVCNGACSHAPPASLCCGSLTPTTGWPPAADADVAPCRGRCRALFPRARLVGDDWSWEGVRAAVRQFASEHPEVGALRCRENENWWYFETPAVEARGGDGRGWSKRQGVEFVAAQQGDG